MSIATTVRTAGPFAGTGSLVALPFAFKVFAASDLVVQRTNVAGDVATLTLTTHYSVSLNADQDTSPGGTVTLVTALAVGETAALTSSVSATQPLQLASGGPFLPGQIEDALDRAMIVVQQQGVLGEQTLRVPLGETALILPSADQRANKALLFDADGDPYLAAPASGSAADLALSIASTASGKGAELVGFTWANTPVSQAVASYGVRTAARGYNILRDVDPANWAGIAAGTYTTDMASILVAAATAGRDLHMPAGTYYVSTATFPNLSNLRISGDGPGATIIKPLTTGAAAEPTFKFSATSAVRITLDGISFVGNGLSGAAGNGNAISFINTAGTGFAPQLLTLRDVYIEGFLGTGKDNTGASMPSAGIFGYLGTSAYVENVSVYSCAQSLALSGYQKVYSINFVTDFAANRGLYLLNCENVDFFGGILNRCGSGGATDGSIVPQGCANLNFYGVRLKDANPAHLNSRSTTFINRDMSFFGCDWNQLAGVNTMIDCGTGDCSLKIKAGRWKWDSSVTAGVGVNVGNGPGGFQMTGLVVEDVIASIGAGGTIANLVLINNSTGVVHAPRIRSLQFGDGSPAGSATNVTNGVHLSGIIDSPIIEGLNLHAATNYTITNAVNIDAAGGNIINPVIIAPVYRTTGGTITNQLVNTTGATVTLIQSGVVSSGNVRSNAASTGLAGATTIGATTATSVGAAGAAAALPATPLGYIIGHVGTTQVKVPYYNP